MIRRALENCQALGLVTVTKGRQGTPDRWRLRDEWRAAFSEMLEGGPLQHIRGGDVRREVVAAAYGGIT